MGIAATQKKDHQSAISLKQLRLHQTSKHFFFIVFPKKKLRSIITVAPSQRYHTHQRPSALPVGTVIHNKACIRRIFAWCFKSPQILNLKSTKYFASLPFQKQLCSLWISYSSTMVRLLVVICTAGALYTKIQLFSASFVSIISIGVRQELLTRGGWKGGTVRFCIFEGHSDAREKSFTIRVS